MKGLAFHKRLSFVLPALFAAAVGCIHLIVQNSKGMEGAGFLYYLPALPWTIFFLVAFNHHQHSQPAMPWAALIVMWVINAVLLCALGWWIDFGLELRRRRRNLGLS